VVSEWPPSDALRYSGAVAYRALVPAAFVPDRSSRVCVFTGAGAHCVWYPVSDAMYSLVLVCRERHAGGRAVSDGAALRSAFAGWHRDVVRMVSAVPSWTRWPLYDRWPLTRWRSRGIALIGDAAHPMVPFTAQGANQAIESAVTLATLLSGQAATATDLDVALAGYERLRSSRVRQVAAAARRNGSDLHRADGARPGPDRSIAEHSGLADQAWLFGHDAEAVALAGIRAVTGPSAALAGCAS
jgi:salicylate hydroxylase